MKRIVPFLTLFASFGTLICCALPALFVSIGLGAVVATTVGSVPQLIWLSENKTLVFGVAGILLFINIVYQIFAKDLSCPTDPKLRDACIRGRIFSKWALIASIVIYFIGSFFAFLGPIIFS